MAFTFGFYNSLNGDRKYNTEQISAIFDGLIKDGVFVSQGDIFAVVPGNGMQVLVKTGRAWFRHTWNFNDSIMPLNLQPAHVTLSRYDAVVLEIDSDLANRTNKIKIISGTTATTPSKPIMANTPTLLQVPLAYILVKPAVSEILQADIQFVVGTHECPFVLGLIEGVNVDALIAQWDSEFNIWWDNIKATLDDNIVTNLQNQIDQRLKIADKATVEDVEAGTNDTKYMTPLKSRKFGETVLNESTGKLIKVRSIVSNFITSDFFRLDSNPTDNVNSHIKLFMDTAYNKFMTNSRFLFVGSKIFVIGIMYKYISNNWQYEPILYVIDCKTYTLVKKFSLQARFGGSQDVHFAPTHFLISRNIGAAFFIRGSSYDALFDVERDILSPTFSAYERTFFITPKYWGYFYLQEYNQRFIRYNVRGNVSFSESINLGNAPHSGYYQGSFLIGVNNNILYMFEQTGQYSSRINRIELADTAISSVVTTGIEQFSTFTSYDSAPIIILEERYILIKVQKSANEYALLKFDMETGVSNAASLTFTPYPFGGNNDLYSFFSAGSYLGSFENSLYFKGSDILIEVDRTTLKIVSVVYGPQILNNLGAGAKTHETFFEDGYIQIGAFIYDVKNNKLIELLGDLTNSSSTMGIADAVTADLMHSTMRFDGGVVPTNLKIRGGIGRNAASYKTTLQDMYVKFVGPITKKLVESEDS